MHGHATSALVAGLSLADVYLLRHWTCKFGMEFQLPVSHLVGTNWVASAFTYSLIMNIKGMILLLLILLIMNIKNITSRRAILTKIVKFNYFFFLYFSL
jgi:hypothetical protein